MTTALLVTVGAVLGHALWDGIKYSWRRRRSVLRPVEMVSIKPLSGRNERE